MDDSAVGTFDGPRMSLRPGGNALEVDGLAFAEEAVDVVAGEYGALSVRPEAQRRSAVVHARLV